MAKLPVSKLAPERFPDLPEIPGVRLGARAANIRYAGRDDLMLAEFPPGTTVAGVFTRSLCPSAPVDWCRAAIGSGQARALLVNAGNANAFTGKAGVDAVNITADAVAKMTGCNKKQVLLASTGVIGEPLPHAKITGALKQLYATLAPSGWRRAADAIRTTDTFSKGASRTCRIDSQRFVINGIAKGSGMIAPDMATMLAFVATDAKIPANVLAKLLKPVVETSFNAITVDGDTSTSDTLLMFASGTGPKVAPIKDARDSRLVDFKRKLEEVLVDLAQQVVKDGEGAQKFVAVTVTGAASPEAARTIAKSIANSPLVKTAVAAGDANWGRVVMAVGKSGQRADRDKLKIAIGEVVVAEHGQVATGYQEAKVATHLKGKDVSISVDVGVGKHRATVWTCDLTHGYIDINGAYRS
ncbi:MAG: bifunctional glutamate N-acetyltransferase/amino-acid acetyltransferase ArgJ [Alphaproteobacteria bacterium]|nr:bifunctional glutamate N-acetyltransferase/amino-acid acetyltransferase ArgJ [Alphaproteobacteria bacterium]